MSALEVCDVGLDALGQQPIQFLAPISARGGELFFQLCHWPEKG
jgi:hypothetical protein